MKYHWLRVDFFKIKVNPIDQLRFRFNSYATQHLLCHLTEEALNHVEPRAVFRCEYELKPFGNRCKILLCLLRCMNFEVIKYQAYLIAFWILIIKYLQEFNIVLAVMGLTDQGDCFPGLQVNSCKE